VGCLREKNESMRIHLNITKNQTVVPYDHIPVLAGAIHKWLGQNEWHNQLSLHSFSWLRGGETGNDGLYFPRGAEWFISSHETVFIKKLIQGIQDDPAINYGFRVKAITIQETPQFSESHYFTLASPVLIKRKDGEKVKHYIFSDHQANKLMTETLMTKLKKVGLNSDGVHVAFNKDYPIPKTKLVNYNGIGNKASICPITIKGSPEQIAFAWNVGIGNSTGIGFGALN
jgi:CRISPR-associated endoribonuclease Cas6